MITENRISSAIIFSALLLMPQQRALADLNDSLIPLLNNDQFVHQGFHGERAPDDAKNIPITYLASDGILPIQSSVCSVLSDSNSTCPRFHEVDVFLSLDDGISQATVDNLKETHPWTKLGFGDSVIARRIPTLEELEKFFGQIVQRCGVVRHLLISSHGAQGVLKFKGIGDATGVFVPVSQVLFDAGLTCVLAPQARVQFDGCKVACRSQKTNSAADRLTEFNQIAKDPRYGAPSRPHPLQGVKFLFNSTTGRMLWSSLNWLFEGPGWNNNVGLLADDNGAVMYTFEETSVITDIPVANVSECDNSSTLPPRSPFMYK